MFCLSTYVFYTPTYARQYVCTLMITKALFTQEILSFNMTSFFVNVLNPVMNINHIDQTLN